jgi:hypothetical protein
MSHKQEGLPPTQGANTVIVLENDMLRVFGAEQHAEFVFNLKTLVWNRHYNEEIDYPLEHLHLHAQVRSNWQIVCFCGLTVYIGLHPSPSFHSFIVAIMLCSIDSTL